MIFLLTQAIKCDIILKLSENSGQDIEKKYKKVLKRLDKAEEIWYNIKAAFESGKTLKGFEKTFKKALDKRSKV